MEKIITVHGKEYKTVPELEFKSNACACACAGCSFYKIDSQYCDTAISLYNCMENAVIFVENKSTIPQTKPTIQMNLELDLSSCILPVFFTVKNLRLQSLETALKNQSDAYNVSVKDLPQETIEVVAEALKQEFIKRNTKVHDV